MRKLFTLFAAAIVAATMYATEGALPGVFTINANGDKVQFSQGNLQYQPSTKMLRFAENQWDFIGTDTIGNVYDGEIKCNNVNGFGASYTHWRDLFGWGTGDNPVKMTNNNSDFPSFTDWGINAITNGGNLPNLWRTLTKDEWNWLLFKRENASSLRGMVMIVYDGINSIQGLVLLPDDWATTFTPMTYSLNQWKQMEEHGAIFLPCAGRGYAGGVNCFTGVSGINQNGDYWTASANEDENAYHLHFARYQNKDVINFWNSNRRYGCSVRLVQPVEEPVDVHPVPPAKALTGRFSVAADKQIIFAQGDLTYNPAIGKWAFSKNQYDMEGLGNYNVFVNGNPESYNGWMDLFGWGTAANPTETSQESAAYASFTDWTTNTIENADGKTWYTMTEDEWNYLLSTRADAASKQGQALVEDVKGYILLPDNWTLPAGLTFTAMPNNYTANVYTSSQWEKLEAAGAVFLPAAGFRYGIEINGLSAGNGYYWTPTPSSQYDEMAQALMISEYSKAKVNFGMPCYGYSVRPVREVQASEAIEQTPSPLRGETERGSKLLRNGHLLIERNGTLYNAQGAQVRF